MDFQFTEEQVMLRETVARFCRDKYAFDKRQQLVGETAGGRYWSDLAEMGLLMVPFAEEDGGVGGSMIEVMLIMQEFGRALVIEPYLANIVLVGGIVKRLPDAARRAALLAPLMSGEKRMSLAHAEADNRSSLSMIATFARKDGGNYVLNGAKIAVLDGGRSDEIIVSAEVEGAPGVTLFLVPGDASGIERFSYTTVDGFDAANITLKDVQVDASAVLGAVAGGIDLLEPTMDEAIVAIAAEGIGVMAYANEATLEYTKTRKQFGVPIAGFQALQHRMVDMFIEREQTTSLLYRAAVLSKNGGVEAQKAASILKMQLAKSCRYIGQQAVQLHGGMGIADEAAVAHYFKRLTIISQQFGTADVHARRFAALDHPAFR